MSTGKIPVYLEPIAAVLSKKSRRPVQLVMSRTDVFDASGPAPGGKVVVKKEAKEVREATNSQDEDGNGNAERESLETSQTVQRCRNYESDARVHEV